jgi:hypothetical protein
MLVFGKLWGATRDNAHRIQNIEYLWFDGAVVQIQAITPGFDQSSVFQDHQLLRDICLSQPQRSFHVTDALLAVAQNIQNCQPCRVGESL